MLRPLLVRVRAVARARGLELVKIDWDASLHGLTVARLLDRYRVGTVLDVGAREGEYGLWLREQGFTGRIASFEPVPANLAVLRARAAADPSWTVHPYALGSVPETRQLHVTAWTHFSSFRDARTDVVSTGLDKRAVSADTDVEVRRLSDVWDEVVGAAAGGVMLKCDTQGWDLEVLQGGAEVLGRVSVLQSEVSNLPIYQGMPDMLESLAAFRSYGFTVTGLYPLNGGADFTPVEFDCLAVRPT